MKKKLSIIALLLALSACGSSEPPIKIEASDNVGVKVFAIVDQLEVKDIIVNRGNCKMANGGQLGEALFGKSLPAGQLGEALFGKSLPKSLKFGESILVVFTGPCEIAEVEVETDQGVWTQKY